nr:MAG TPA: hypothetical protein [Caudoviricetes sp.]
MYFAYFTYFAYFDFYNLLNTNTLDINIFYYMEEDL